MKIGIVVPFSWSYWGGVVEHAENQAAALRARGHEVKIVMGHDPPGRADALAPSALRPPRRPAAGDHPGRPLGRRAGERVAAEHRPLAALDPPRARGAATSERFDVVHLHEPMTPTICVATLAYAQCPIVATWHAAGDLGWMRLRDARLGLPDGADRRAHRRLADGGGVGASAGSAASSR